MQRGNGGLEPAVYTGAGDDAMLVLDQLAHGVVSKGLAAPALFLLELHRPLASVLCSGMQVLLPMAVPLLGVARARALNSALARRESWAFMIEAIERHAAAARRCADARS